MALRLLEVAVARDHESRIADLIREYERVASWRLESSTFGAVFHVVLPAEDTEALMDAIESASASSGSLRMVLVPAEASVPHVESKPAEEAPGRRGVGLGTRWRVGREELYEDATDGASVSPTFYLLISLSAVVASLGLLKDNVAVIIGAMVIAPLYGPNASLAVGTSLGDTQLLARSLKALGLGLLVALGLSALTGAVLPVNAATPSIATRTVVGYTDVVLALAAGAAGALAFTAGRIRALTGVVVAVALLPPIVAFGLLLGSGQVSLAWGALLLAAVNVICINLAAVAAFVLQGVRPRSWWEAERARRATRRAAAIWVALLALLVAILALD
ncbi:MAG: TIGR00341 family protein [Candidatus Eisenbacteria bacterium]|nr:TIGR00341 family protein [Candidatus Eisenbacteria bacterium]